MERRKLLQFGLTAGVRLFMLGGVNSIASAESTDFPWTKEEVLFGPNAGFEKARLGEALSIWKDPTLGYVDLEQAISPWNKLALSLGREIFFKAAPDASIADIKVGPGSKNMTVPSPNYLDPYKSCKIFLVPYAETKVLIHEFGHALGLVDFVQRRTNIEQFINPARCDNSEKPYFGVMSYCDIKNSAKWFGKDDSSLLRVAGLAPHNL